MTLFTDSYSRFGDTPSIVYDHRTMGPQEIFGVWKQPTVLTRGIPDSQVIRFVVPKSLEGRPDLIAANQYGVSTLDWLVIAYNNATQVFGWPKAGQVIKLPASTYIASELL